MKTTLYRYFDDNDQLLYVGITKNQFQRLNTHAHNQPWWDEVAYGKFVHYETRDLAAREELIAIANEFPKYNKAGATISPESRKHLSGVLANSFNDPWHTHFSSSIYNLMTEINSFSSASESFKLAFAFDRAFPYDDQSSERVSECLDCDSILQSKWFKQVIYEADSIICDEAVSK